MKYLISILVMMLFPICAWSEVGDVFFSSAHVMDGDVSYVPMQFMVTDEVNLYCVVHASNINDHGTKAAIDSGTSGILYVPSVATKLEEYTDSNGQKKTIEKQYAVIRVDPFSFYECQYLTGVVLPSSISIIDRMAFRGCTNLVSIEIPESVTNIGIYVFSECVSLQSVVIHDGVKEIGYGAFSHCRSLVNIDIPDQTVLGANMFAGCTSLTSFKFPSVMEYIPEAMFSDCTSLSSVILPSGLKEIPYLAFSNTGFTTFEIPSTVTEIAMDAFNGCSLLESIYIPDNVTTIQNGAFANCSRLTKLKIGKGLYQCGNKKSSGVEPFYKTNSIAYADINCNAFIDFNTESLKRLVFGDNVETVYSYGALHLSSLFIGKNVKDIQFSFFGYESNPRQIVSYIEEPFDIDEFAFNPTVNENAILYVPANCKTKYQERSGWKKFMKIIEMNYEGYIIGDANGDSLIDVADVVCMQGYLLGKQNINFVQSAADTNDDGIIDSEYLHYVIDMIFAIVNH